MRGSVVGPNVSIEGGAIVEGSVLKQSIVFANGRVEGSVLDESLVGQYATVRGMTGPINVGDHSQLGARD